MNYNSFAYGAIGPACIKHEHVCLYMALFSIADFSVAQIQG